MCHGEGSSPPRPPGTAGAIAERGDLLLRAADGNRFLAYRSVPTDGDGVGVVVMPDVRGLHDFYRHLADRFAELGIAAVAMDYYGRTAEDHVRDGAFDGFAHARQLSPEQTAADVRAAIDRLAADGVTTVFTVGFCLGGAASWRQSALDGRVAGAIGFYGRPDEARPMIGRMRAPLLVLAAGADMLTSAEDARLFAQELTEAGVPHRFVLYEGAPHSFFDGGFAEHREAGDDAWRQVLAFVDSVSERSGSSRRPEERSASGAEEAGAPLDDPRRSEPTNTVSERSGPSRRPEERSASGADEAGAPPDDPRRSEPTNREYR